MTKPLLCAEWINDCQGKKDYDGPIISISTRYWPRGGGFDIYEVKDGKLIKHDEDMSIGPSAESSLVINRRLTDDDYNTYSIDLASKKFEGDSFEEVAAQVEAWAQGQMDRVVEILQEAFNGE